MAYSQSKKESITNETIAALNSFITDVRVPTQFEKASLLREVNKVKTVDLVDYFPCASCRSGSLLASHGEIS